MKLRHLLVVLACLPVSLGWSLAENEISGPGNGTHGTANGPFTFPDTLTGNLAQDGEGLLDFFKFTGTAGVTYRFVGSVTNGSSPGLDLEIGVENSAGIILVSADANGVGGAGATETLNFTPPSTATYYFYVWEATGTANGIQSYSVSASQLSGVNDWELY